MRSLTESSGLRSVELSLIRQVMNSASPDAVNLALGELGFAMPSALRTKAIELLSESTPVYTPNAGLAETREAIAGVYHPGSDPGQLCVTNGAEEAIFITLLSLIEPGDRIAIPDPDYSAYPAICEILGAEVVRLPFSGDFHTIDWDAWESILSTQIKAIVMSNPCNPSGFVLDQDSAVILAGLCDQHGIAIVVDEIYSKLYFDSFHVSLGGYADNTFTINGLSKSHCMSGWRLGWVHAPASMISAIIKAKQYVSTCSNWLAQKIAFHALSPMGLKASETIRTRLSETRDYTLKRLAFSSIAPLVRNIPRATPYLMLKLDTDDLAIAQALAKKGVLTVPGSAFGNSSRGWLRINYALDIPLLERGLTILDNELSAD